MRSSFFFVSSKVLLMVFLIFTGCSKIDSVNEVAIPTTDTDHKILILMYHELVNGEANDIYQRTSADFENDLLYIKSKKYEVISLDDLTKIKSGNKTLHSDAVIITFDDGYESDYRIAFQKLKYYSMPATFYVVTDWIGEENRLSWNQAWEMDMFHTYDGKKLFSIESHSRSHPFMKTGASNFTNYSDYVAFITAELAESKNWIYNITNQATIWLALPYGDGANDSLIIQAAKANGYSGIRTSVYGSFDIESVNLFAMPSLPVLSTTNISDMENYLE